VIHTLSIKSSRHEELIDITPHLQKIVAESQVHDGLCCIYTPHTTAGITINENADPDVKKDILKGLSSLNLDRISFAHMEGNSPAHIKSSLVGCSAIVFVDKNRLQLGTWQGVYFCEFDGPRSRTVSVKLL
jgi:secondary thiamine-phosphate synthase enzyme